VCEYNRRSRNLSTKKPNPGGHKCKFFIFLKKSAQRYCQPNIQIGIDNCGQQTDITSTTCRVDENFPSGQIPTTEISAIRSDISCA